MSGDLHSAGVDFRRKMFELLEKSMTNVLARLESELQRLKLRRSLIRHLPLPSLLPIAQLIQIALRPYKEVFRGSGIGSMEMRDFLWLPVHKSGTS